MNFLKAQVSAGGNEVILPGGVALKVETDKTGPLRGLAGKAVTFGIRPEDVGMPGKGTGAVLPARIVLTEPLGSDTLALIRIGESEITGRFPPDAGLRVGGELQVCLDVRKAHFFDASTGKALVDKALA